MKELLFSLTKKDFNIEYFSGTGKGGQYRNKHQNCVRIHHKASGILVTGQSHRNRIGNIKEAFNNLINHPKFKVWHTRKTNEIIAGKSIEEKVKETMNPKNLKIEIKKDGKWIDE